MGVCLSEQPQISTSLLMQRLESLFNEKTMKQKFDYLIIVLMAFLAHGLLLISDGIFWDDWLDYTSLASKDHFLLHRMTSQQGIPASYYFWLSFTILPDIILSQRIIVFMLIILSAFVVYAICNEYGKTSRIESMMIVTIFMTYPAFETWLLISTSQYIFYYFIFLLASLITLRIRIRKFAGLKAAGLRVLSLALFFISFSLNSLLILHFGFLAFLFIVYLEQGFSTKQEAAFRFVIHYVDYLLLPFAFWFIKLMFFPQYGIYANYNQVSFSLSRALISIAFFVVNGVFYQISSSIFQVIKTPVLWLFVFCLAAGVANFRLQKIPVCANKNDRILFIWFGLALLGLGMLPYVLAGKYPTLHGWDTRHTLLLSLPVGIILVANISFIFAKPDQSLNWGGWLSFFILFVGFNVQTIDQYIGWQQRWIKDKSVMMRLEKMDKEKNIPFFG
jgi:hypothetical protein